MIDPDPFRDDEACLALGAPFVVARDFITGQPLGEKPRVMGDMTIRLASVTPRTTRGVKSDPVSICIHICDLCAYNDTLCRADEKANIGTCVVAVFKGGWHWSKHTK